MADKILIVACHFPPAGGIQVQRALSLAKYLPQNGFEVHVLTTRYPQVPFYDLDLLRQVPDSVKIHRTWSLEPPFHIRKRLWRFLGSGDGSQPDNAITAAPGNLLGRFRASVRNQVTRRLAPDPQRLWYPFALKKALKIMAREQIRFVLITAPPFSTFLIGNALKAACPQIRLISEFRDEWLAYFLPTFAFRDEALKHRAEEIEKETVERSDCIVAVTPTTLRAIRSRYSNQPGEKFQLLLNGYDPDVFASFQSRPHHSGRIVVTYVGTVYKPSSPAAYLDALDLLPEHIRSRFETRFVGRTAAEIDLALFRNRKSAIKLVDFVPQHEAIRCMEETDFLLLPWADRLNVPGRLYEYLATKKPIIGLVCPGSDAHDILKGSGLALLASADDGAAIARCLEQIGQNPAAAGNLVPNRASIEQYARPGLVAKYADLIRGGLAADDAPSLTEHIGSRQNER